jgi:hypothetical protein
VRRTSSLILVLVGLLVLWSAAFPAAPHAGDGGESVAVEDGEEGPCKSDCPGDDENGECPPDCDACPCCPAAVSPVVSSDGTSASFGEVFAVNRPSGGAGQTQDGALSRVFHPPRLAAS